MDEKVKEKLEALTEKARQEGTKEKARSRNRSSLYKIIKTKKQADTFMFLLKNA